MRDASPKAKFFRSFVFASLLVFACGGPAPAESGDAAKSGNWREEYRRPPSIPYPSSNPFTPEKAELGRALFFDTRLSASMTMSCASCHKPDHGWSDGFVHARGDGAVSMLFHSPSLLDIAWLDRLGWDGKFRDIEAVTFAPIVSPAGMSMTEEKLLARLSADRFYVEMFARAFPGKAIDRRTIELAMATFERSIASKTAPFDRWIEGDESAMPEAAKRGFALFSGKAKCTECHSGWAFTDGSFHDIGVAKEDEPGRGRFFPTSLKLQHAFKTPTLRNDADRGPYMHDGSIATLEEVIELYNKGGVDRPSRAEVIKPLGLNAIEKADLLAFLRALSDDQISGTSRPDDDLIR
ncbi:MAG: cytochrome c peroxidase [Beijerinckiaceae bacterium]|jgi:cytochrome c peroxidase